MNTETSPQGRGRPSATPGSDAIRAEGRCEPGLRRAREERGGGEEGALHPKTRSRPEPSRLRSGGRPPQGRPHAGVPGGAAERRPAEARKMPLGAVHANRAGRESGSQPRQRLTPRFRGRRRGGSEGPAASDSPGRFGGITKARPGPPTPARLQAGGSEVYGDDEPPGLHPLTQELVPANDQDLLAAGHSGPRVHPGG